MKRRERSKAGKTGASRRASGASSGSTGVRASGAPSAGRATGGRRGRGKRKRRSLASRIKGLSPRTVIVLILIVFFLTFAFGPTTRNLEATLRVKKNEAELARQKAVTESLKREVEETRSLEYVEREARGQRMVLPGEVLYLVTSDEEESRVKRRVKSLQSMDEAWERVRVMLNSEYSRNERGD